MFVTVSDDDTKVSSNMGWCYSSCRCHDDNNCTSLSCNSFYKEHPQLMSIQCYYILILRFIFLLLQTFKIITRQEDCKLVVLVHKRSDFEEAVVRKPSHWWSLCSVRRSSFILQCLRRSRCRKNCDQQRISSNNDATMSHTTTLCSLHYTLFLLELSVWMEFDLVYFGTCHNILLRSHLCMVVRWCRCHTNPPQIEDYTFRWGVLCVLLKQHSWVRTDHELNDGLPFSPEVQSMQVVSAPLRCLRKHLGLFVSLKVHPVQSTEQQMETQL